MASVTNVVLMDGQPTPVAHTFNPSRTSSDFAQYENRSIGIYIGYEKLTLSLSRPKGTAGSNARNLKANVRIETPVLETLGSAQSGFVPPATIAYRLVADVTFTLSERSTSQQRKDLRRLMGEAMSHASVIAMLEQFEMPY